MNNLTILKFKQKKDSRDIINKIEIKPLIIPYIGALDDSTINHVKRIGGQILQLYSLHNMEVSIGGNDIFYYLLSGLYPLNVEEDSSKHGLAFIEIEIVTTKVTKIFKEDTVIEGASFLSADIEKTREYTYVPTAPESIEVSSRLIDFDIVDFIRYTEVDAGRVDAYTAVSAGLIGFDLLSFPLLYKNVEEISTAALTTIEIEII